MSQAFLFSLLLNSKIKVMRKREREILGMTTRSFRFVSYFEMINSYGFGLGNGKSKPIIEWGDREKNSRFRLFFMSSACVG